MRTRVRFPPPPPKSQYSQLLGSSLFAGSHMGATSAPHDLDEPLVCEARVLRGHVVRLVPEEIAYLAQRGPSAQPLRRGRVAQRLVAVERLEAGSLARLHPAPTEARRRPRAAGPAVHEER